MDAKKLTVEEFFKKIETWLGVQSLYLLTTTAEQFFLRRGYARKTL
jgi:N-acetylglutamate synthase-like GNAT family acetyltransferase